MGCGGSKARVAVLRQSEEPETKARVRRAPVPVRDKEYSSNFAVRGAHGVRLAE
jgi:hypothetical protein